MAIKTVGGRRLASNWWEVGGGLSIMMGGKLGGKWVVNSQ